ncbi:SCO2584 family spore wall biosynthesis protein [Embleya sp. NPDC055664]|uniref:SCO2584 family spore wall biosynthesis protein n=1 Tax=Embleya sp. NPDC059237 TaxID=3346784 RepID=UPI003697138A
MPDSPGPEFPDGPDFPEFSEDELSSVVFDESFVRAARVHEPSANERGAAIDAAPTPTAAAPERTDRTAEQADRSDWFDDGTYPPDGEDPWRARTVPGHDTEPMLPHVPAWFAGEPWAKAARTTRWRRGVAWVLALLMGVGVVAMAVTAVYRSGSSQGPTAPRQPSVGTGRSATTDNNPVPAPPGQDTSQVRITVAPGDSGAAGGTAAPSQAAVARSGPG